MLVLAGTDMNKSVNISAGCRQGEQKCSGEIGPGLCIKHHTPQSVHHAAHSILCALCMMCPAQVGLWYAATSTRVSEPARSFGALATPTRNSALPRLGASTARCSRRSAGEDDAEKRRFGVAGFGGYAGYIAYVRLSP